MKVFNLTDATPSNLARWGKAEDGSCQQCGVKPGTLRHILNGCKDGLTSGIFRWRHDHVLEKMHTMVSSPGNSTE